MGPIGFGFDQNHKVLTHRQIFWVANFIGSPVAHLDDERRKGRCPEQFGKLFFHVVTPDPFESLLNCISYRREFQVFELTLGY